MYKIVDGNKVLMTDADKATLAALESQISIDPAPSLEDRVTETEKNVSNLQAEMDDFGYIFTGKEVSHEDT